ncbi:MAG: ArgR family transcriptional regulator [Clostridia bacterium]|nr:ArgR family transcriptional regulator [Clostridia bacterium]MBR3908995.1 ArgR family transcriptional regulator [Clostridia bacterium]MBR6565171.1 ArgR family transcriptional regulator [Clostridia bacterium]
MKHTRQKQIIDIIKSKIIFTQEDLQNELLNLGFDVTQSTVSRDIKELKLYKSRDKEGNYRYVTNNIRSDNTQRNIFTSSVLSVDYALNNVVIKCRTGMASGACVALDDIFHEYMLGSLAGDDTIIVVTHSVEDSKTLVEQINNIL